MNVSASQPPLNSQRALVELIDEICRTRQIELTRFSDDWILRLHHRGRTTCIFGYDFELNTATAKLICKDKSATSDLLAFYGLPRVEHRLFHSPQLAAYVPMTGNWEPMLRFFEKNGRDVVCKPNEGTGGRNVFRARTPFELESAVIEIFARNRSLCLSPYVGIRHEYRVAILNGEVVFIYQKERPSLTGDGRRTVRELLLASLQSAADPQTALGGISELSEMQIDYDLVPPAGTRVIINWRHNLGLGSAPVLLDVTAADLRPVGELARRATEALGVGVASVDIILSAEGLMILEINSGIMMESFARSSPEGRRTARDFYDRIVCSALGINSVA